MQMKIQEEKLLSLIETTREKLNNSIGKETNTFKCSPKTHMLSKELDKLIYRYMLLRK
jgi:hypothetical protein